MARIRKFDKSAHRGGVHPTEVDCEHATIDSPQGRLLVLSTMGSDQRQSRPKVSQTLQLDRERAQDLLRIIDAAFPGLTP